MADKPSGQKEGSGRDERLSKDGPSEEKIRDRHIRVPAITRPESAMEVSVRPGDVVTLKAEVGALIGSFDGFRHSFVIGASTSIQVPNGADSLGLAVNDNGEASYQSRGDDYVVEVFIDRKGPRSS